MKFIQVAVDYGQDGLVNVKFFKDTEMDKALAYKAKLESGDPYDADKVRLETFKV